jgi:hypothetical protein
MLSANGLLEQSRRKWAAKALPNRGRRFPGCPCLEAAKVNRLEHSQSRTCHFERSRIITIADDPAESRNLLFRSHRS